MPEDLMVPAGPYNLTKQFRREQMRRQKKDLPWTKRVYDVDEKKLFGRTAFGWMRIVMFYLVLYTLIGILLALWVCVLKFWVIPTDHPHLLKKAPGVSLMPSNSSTLKFFPSEHTTIYPIADEIDAFLHGVNDNAMDYFSDFNADDVWGYKEGKPCIFVRLNKVFGFKASTYDTPEELPRKSPPELTDVIRKHGGTPRIWLTTKVETGPQPTILYYPGPFFDTSDKMTGVQRVVAVQLSNMPANVDITIDFRVWARNIEYEARHNGKGHAKLIVNKGMHSPLKPTETPKPGKKRG